MIENTIINKNKAGLKALTFSLTFPSPQLVEMAAHVGFDAVNLDGEHGTFSPESVDLMCQIANGYGMSVTARVPNNMSSTINLFLDRGVQGITGPHIETGEEAQSLADACLFPTDGWRSWGGGRGTEFGDIHMLEKKYGGKLKFARWSNANMIVQAQIESKKAYDNLDDILAVKGLTGIVGGPNDFAASLGYPGQPDHPERQRLTTDAENRAKEAGKTTSDNGIGMAISDMMLTDAHRFVERHSKDTLEI